MCATAIGEGAGWEEPIENIDLREIDLREHGTAARMRIWEEERAERRRAGEGVVWGMRENERESAGANSEGCRRDWWRSTPNNCEESMSFAFTKGYKEKKDELMRGVP